MIICVGIALGLAGLWMLCQNSATRFGAPLTVAGVVLILVGVFG